MPKLTDTQAVLLSSAAQRPEGSLLPAPKTLSAGADAITKAITAMLKIGLVEEVAPTAAAQAWRSDGDERFGAAITDAGRIAIGVELQCAAAPADDGNAASPLPPATGEPRSTKAALVLSLLRREQGATLNELVEATGWLPYTARAALTGIRKKGHAIAKSKRDNVTCYTLAA